MDSEMWGILNDGFGSKPGTSGSSFRDTDLDASDDSDNNEDGENSSVALLHLKNITHYQRRHRVVDLGLLQLFS